MGNQNGQTGNMHVHHWLCQALKIRTQRSMLAEMLALPSVVTIVFMQPGPQERWCPT